MPQWITELAMYAHALSTPSLPHGTAVLTRVSLHLQAQQDQRRRPELPFVDREEARTGCLRRAASARACFPCLLDTPCRSTSCT